MTRLELREHLANSRPFFRRALARVLVRDLLKQRPQRMNIIAAEAVRLAQETTEALEKLEEVEYV